jgi:hypothetical protein
VYEGRVECGGFYRECGAILCTVCYTLYYEALRLAVSVFVPYAMVELRSCCGYAVARDALLRFVTLCCVLV